MLNLWPILENSIDFDAPHYLILLAALPLFWLVGRRSLHALGAWRRHAALGLRLAVAVLLILALAEVNWQTLIRRLTVLFVVDASDSIQREELDQALAYVNAAVKQRDAARGDRAGVIVFGRGASVEIPPLERPWPIGRIESDYDARFTNLEAALQLAEATFPADSAKRVVIVSDGNENLGQAQPQAAKLLDAGVGIDCVPISYQRRGEVVVEKVDVPTDVRRSTPFGLRLVLNNLSEGPVSGRLRITRELGGTRHVVVEQPLELEPGKQVFSVRQELTEAGMFAYQANFIPDDPTDDTRSENNRATGFCRVSGRGHVLLIEEASSAGRFDGFVQLLRENEIEVTVRDSCRAFDNLADLQQFDAVILADVARVADDGPADLYQFSDEQIHQLVQNTEHFGCGLIVLGGPNSYGAGGWINTELEKALPVDCRIDSAKVEAIGALMLVIDSSGSMAGEKIAWSRAAAKAAAEMLGPRDYIGVVTFDSEPQWRVPLRRNQQPKNTRARIDRIGAAGGTNMMPALEQAYRTIQGCDASLKHVIVLTDGQTPRENYEALVRRARDEGITTSGVAVGPGADRQLLTDISQRGGGKFYHVLSPKAIPRIFMREARRVAMPLVFEDRNGIAIQTVGTGELLAGIEGPPPPVTGMVLTTVKQDPLVEVLWATPRQPPPNSTILAVWPYGIGRVAALTTDIGQRWATDWSAWGNDEKFLLQLVRWAMRGHDQGERLTMSTEVRAGAIRVVVHALDDDDASLNFLQLVGTAVLPNGASREFSFEQLAPGRYVGNLAAGEPGNYFLAVSGGGRTAPLRTAVSVTSTADLQPLVSYEEFLAQLAEARPQGGEPGRMIQSPQGIGDTEGLLRTNVFRDGVPPARSRDAVWPVALMAATAVFLADVFCRRVVVGFGWLPLLVRWLPFGRRPIEAADALPIERLRQSKVAATAHFDTARSADRFEPGPEVAAPASTRTDDPRTAAITAAPPASSTDAADPSESPEYTARLLALKKRLRDERRG